MSIYNEYWDSFCSSSCWTAGTCAARLATSATCRNAVRASQAPVRQMCTRRTGNRAAPTRATASAACVPRSPSSASRSGAKEASRATSSALTSSTPRAQWTDIVGWTRRNTILNAKTSMLFLFQCTALLRGALLQKITRLFETPTCCALCSGHMRYVIRSKHW